MFDLGFEKNGVVGGFPKTQCWRIATSGKNEVYFFKLIMTAWKLANPSGILAKGFTIPGLPSPQFNAGQISGIVQLERELLLASTPKSGIWSLNLKTKVSTPLSLSWNSADLRCIAQGRTVAAAGFDVFAGGGSPSGSVLWRHDFTAAPPLRKWIRIDISTLMAGTINAMVVANTNDLVLACDNGVFWCEIPTTPSGPFTFHKAEEPSGLLGFKWTSVCRGGNSDNSLLVVAWDDSSLAGSGRLVRGLFSGIRLILRNVTIPSTIPGTEVFRCLVGASADDQTRIAVLGSRPSMSGSAPKFGSIRAVIKSTDSSMDVWSEIGSSIFADIHQTGKLEDWAGAIAFSATSSMIFAIGWADAYFLTNNGGSSWKRLSTSGDNIHFGVHAICFDNIVGSSSALFLGTTGGFFSTNDAGNTHSSEMNRNLPNLQLLNGALDNHFAGICAGSRAENRPEEQILHKLFCNLYSNFSFWHPMRDQDRGAISVLRNGQMVTYNIEPGPAFESPIQARRLDPFNRSPGWANDIDHIPLIPAQIWRFTTTDVQPLEAVATPFASADGKSLVGLSAQGKRLYGIMLEQNSFGHAPRNDLFATELAILIPTVPFASENITTVASADGTSILVGTDSGRFLIATPPSSSAGGLWSLDPMNVDATGTGGRLVTKICSKVGGPPFAIVQGAQFFGFSSVANSWNHLPPPSTDELVDLVVSVEEGSIFVATDKKVFQSPISLTPVWTDISAGLPASPHCTQLAFLQESGGSSFLYVFTNGWSLFRKLLRSGGTDRRTVSVSFEMGITVGGDPPVIFRLPPTSLSVSPDPSVAYFDVTAPRLGDVVVALSIRFEYLGTAMNRVEARSDVWLNNSSNGKKDRQPGVTVVLDPGSSFYQNVRVDNGAGDVADVNFLIAN